MKYFFGEFAYYQYGNDFDKSKAENYLQVWKEQLIRKLSKDYTRAKIIDETYKDILPEFISCLALYGAVSIKVCVEIDFDFQIDPSSCGKFSIPCLGVDK